MKPPKARGSWRLNATVPPAFPPRAPDARACSAARRWAALRNSSSAAASGARERPQRREGPTHPRLRAARSRRSRRSIARQGCACWRGPSRDDRIDEAWQEDSAAAAEAPNRAHGRVSKTLRKLKDEALVTGAQDSHGNMGWSSRKLEAKSG